MSRLTEEAALEILSHDRERLIDARGSDYSGVEALDMAIRSLESWGKLWNWLNDTRFAIAPDEFLDDVDEKLVRVAQVDMIDTIMEWMEKQEVSE